MTTKLEKKKSIIATFHKNASSVTRKAIFAGMTAFLLLSTTGCAARDPHFKAMEVRGPDNKPIIIADQEIVVAKTITIVGDVKVPSKVIIKGQGAVMSKVTIAPKPEAACEFEQKGYYYNVVKLGKLKSTMVDGVPVTVNAPQVVTETTTTTIPGGKIYAGMLAVKTGATAPNVMIVAPNAVTDLRQLNGMPITAGSDLQQVGGFFTGLGNLAAGTGRLAFGLNWKPATYNSSDTTNVSNDSATTSDSKTGDQNTTSTTTSTSEAETGDQTTTSTNEAETGDQTTTSTNTATAEQQQAAIAKQQQAAKANAAAAAKAKADADSKACADNNTRVKTCVRPTVSPTIVVAPNSHHF